MCRCAAEGLNCTLSGSAQGVRDFCMGLRAWNPVFEETDFKITDDVYYGKRFKALTIRKVTTPTRIRVFIGSVW